jgi:hypothetical protein
MGENARAKVKDYSVEQAVTGTMLAIDFMIRRATRNSAPGGYQLAR